MSMSTTSHGRRRSRAVLAAVGVAAVLLTGCTAGHDDPIATIGGDRSGGRAPAEPDEPAAGPDAADAMAAFGRCMRDEGVPIEDGGGSSRERGNGGDDPDLEAAAATCKKHLEGTGVEFAAGGSGRQLPPEQLEGLLDYAKCMRANGIEMPDPDPESGGLLTGEGESGIDTESAEYRRASEQCTSELPDVEVTS